MRKEQATALRELMAAVLPKGRPAVTEIDALVGYMSEVAKSEDEAIQRLSGILQRDINGMVTWQTILQVEMLREKVHDHQERLRLLEQSAKPDQHKWPLVQAIFIAISFIAATVALLKTFGLLNLPWLN